MKEKEDDEDMRIKKAQREMEEKQERELAEKLAKTRTALETIAQHRVKEVSVVMLPTTTSHCYSLYLLHLIFTLFIDYVFINKKKLYLKKFATFLYFFMRCTLAFFHCRKPRILCLS